MRHATLLLALAFSTALSAQRPTVERLSLGVMAGTELTRFGGGVEYYPLGNRDLRLHAVYSYTTGTNANPAGALHDRQSTANVGLTWRLNIKN